MNNSIKCNNKRLNLIGLSYGLLASTFAAPLYFWPGLILGIRFLSSLLYDRYSFTSALMFGFGYWLGLMYWAVIPLYIAGLSTYYPLLLGFFIMPVIFGLQFALPIFISKFFQKPFEKYLAFLLVWFLLETARSFIFPFYPISFSLLSSTMTSQLFAYFSPLILSSFLMIVLMSRGLLYIYITALCVLSTLFTWILPTQTLYGPTFALIQPSIPQKNKNTYLGAKQMEYVIYGLSHDASIADVIVWPEASMPSILDHEIWPIYNLVGEELRKKALQPTSMYVFNVGDESRILASSRLLVGLNYKNVASLGKILIGGIMTTDLVSDSYYNSVVRLDQQGQVRHIYDKQILIPFGEYIPFRNYLFGYFKALATSHGDYKAGTVNKVDVIKFNGQKIKAVYLICYESIFSDILRKDKYDIIFHISNDAWFGESACLNMHFDHMKVQAITHRTPALRSVNTGITALIDSYGRVLAKLKPGVAGVLFTSIVK